MIYYQVTDWLARKNGDVFVSRELFTEKEMDRLKYRKDNENFFVKREIKKSEIYLSFGVRRMIKDPFDPLDFDYWHDRMGVLHVEVYRNRDRSTAIELKLPENYTVIECEKKIRRVKDCGCWCSKDLSLLQELEERKPGRAWWVLDMQIPSEVAKTLGRLDYINVNMELWHTKRKLFNSSFKGEL